ncbi:dihydroorotase [Butyrivibrio sp. CB08]|uniref:dihydroorotase n=1 Tax=Butyrivibrio sp. CB08 TaxID=2364879 RepID=UPI000EAAC5C8|nr:dihydroorotase [Butyrivibrio sp. CB08]RKM55979.1 dihydroorotase [Butyrivibrio sp. CB08]
MVLIKGGYLMDPASETEGIRDIVIDGDKIAGIYEEGSSKVSELISKGAQVIDATGKTVAPGLVDPHVHFRDPGFTYKEDIETGARAAARGGFTSVIMMGNTDPHMDNVATIKDVLKRGAATGIKVYTCANVTMDMAGKELTPMEELIEAGAVLFTDDGKPITDEGLMEEACKRAAALGKVISLHEEDPNFITDNGINQGEVADKLGIVGSPREAEISMVKRDIELAKKTGARLTVQHISTAEAVDMIRQARKDGLKIYAEATPHHFTLTQDAVLEHGTLAKMNPPLRLESDRRAIIEGLKDGTIEAIATDHAPHSKEEKDKPLREAPSGITGLETALSLGIRELVQPGFMTMMQLIERFTVGAARIYELDAGRIYEGGPADLVIFGQRDTWEFDSSFSKASNTPFLGEKLPGKVYETICKGRIVYQG